MQPPAFVARQAEGGRAGRLRTPRLHTRDRPQRLSDLGQTLQHLRKGAIGEPGAEHAGAQRTLGQRRQLRRDRCVRAVQRVEGRGDVVDRPGEQAGMIQAVDEGEHAVPAEGPEGRLQTEDPAEGGRDTHRSIGVRAERQGNQPGRDRRGRAA